MNQEQNNLNQNFNSSQSNNNTLNNQQLNNQNINNSFYWNGGQNINSYGGNLGSPQTMTNNQSQQHSINTNQSQVSTLSPKKKGKIIIPIAIGLVCIVVGSIVAGSFLLNNKSNPNFSENNLLDNPIVDWTSYEVEIENVKYTLPITSARELTKTGLILDPADSDKKLENNLFIDCYMNDSNGNDVFMYYALNKTEQEQLYYDLKVISISQNKYNVKESNIAIIFPGNLKVGAKATEQDIIKILGEPSETKYEEYKYKEGDISIGLYSTDEEYEEWREKMKSYNVNGYSHTIMNYYIKNEYDSIESQYQVYLIDGEIFSLSLLNEKN